MKYYLLGQNNTIIAKVTDDRAVELTAKIGWQDDADAFLNAVEVLREYDTPMFTEGRMKYYFPNMLELDKSAYEAAVEDIDGFNEKQSAVLKEIENTSLDDIRSYITLFPSRLPKLVNYRQLNRLWQALYISRETGYEVSNVLETDSTEEEQIEDIRALYGILRSVEKANDNTLVTEILDVVGNTLDDEEEMFNFSARQSDG